MAYTYPNITNTSTMVDMIIWANDTLGNAFGIGLLGIIFVVSFLMFKNYTTERALMVSLFITTLSSIFMVVMGILPEEYWIIPAVATALSLGYLYYQK